MLDSEISSDSEMKENRKTVDGSFIKLKEINQNNYPLNSTANLNRISRNCVEITHLESWNLYDWEESKPQCLNSSRIMINNSDKWESLRYFQNESKQDWKLEKILNDFKSKIDDTFETFYSTDFDVQDI